MSTKDHGKIKLASDTKHSNPIKPHQNQFVPDLKKVASEVLSAQMAIGKLFLPDSIFNDVTLKLESDKLDPSVITLIIQAHKKEDNLTETYFKNLPRQDAGTVLLSKMTEYEKIKQFLLHMYELNLLRKGKISIKDVSEDQQNWLANIESFKPFFEAMHKGSKMVKKTF